MKKKSYKKLTLAHYLVLLNTKSYSTKCHTQHNNFAISLHHILLKYHKFYQIQLVIYCYELQNVEAKVATNSFLYVTKWHLTIS